MRLIAIALAIAGGLLVTVCSVKREPERRAAPLFPAPAAMSGARSAPDAGAPAVLAEERYAPLLLRPGYEDVVRALDERDDTRAAALVSERLLKTPPNAEEAASYGLTFFTAYRMLVDRADMKPGDNVLVWGASGGLGVFAVQLAKLVGANPIAVVSREDKAEMCRQLGARHIINRTEFDLTKGPAESRRFGKKIRELTGLDGQRYHDVTELLLGVDCAPADMRRPGHRISEAISP